MKKEVLKEKSQNKEDTDELFSDAGQSDALSEYEFFVPEIDHPEEHVHEPMPSGGKKKDDQKNELIDFFLHD